MEKEEQKNLFDAGININIPKSTWLYMAAAITVPAFFIILLLTIKETIAKR